MATTSTSRRNSRFLSIVFWTTVALLGVYSFFFLKPPRFQPVFGAKPYVWPRACPKDKYAYKPVGTIVPCQCADEDNRIKDWYEHGVEAGGKGPTHVYRINNDAVQIEKYDFGS